MSAIIDLDLSVLHVIQSYLRNDLFTPLMNGITMLGDHGIFFIVLTFLLIALRKTRRLGLYCVLSMAFQGVLVNLVIKPLVARPRPYDLVDYLVPVVEKMKDYSYPSGHTCMCMVFFITFLMLGYRKSAFAAGIFTLLMGYSRLYVGVHYPSDVLGGIVWGAVSGIIAVWIGRRIETKIIKK